MRCGWIFENSIRFIDPDGDGKMSENIIFFRIL